MERIKTVRIQDLDNKLIFKIRLFDVEKGLDFLETLTGMIGTLKGETLSGAKIKPLLKDLLPLASLMDQNEKDAVIPSLTLSDVYSVFQNPLAVLELGLEILKHQSVFMDGSETFRGLTDKAKNMFSTPTLG